MIECLNECLGRGGCKVGGQAIQSEEVMAIFETSNTQLTSNMEIVSQSKSLMSETNSMHFEEKKDDERQVM